MDTDLRVLRVVLLVSLSGMLLFLLYRRFRFNTLQKHVPVVRHAELTELLVGYHPSRLLLTLQLPEEQHLAADVLNDRWERVHEWPGRVVPMGAQQLDLPLYGLADGTYYLRLLSVGQSTERQFILRST
ncbi:MAG: hypothetical protein ABI599_00550 [Flavobacteriales bacterium]